MGLAVAALSALVACSSSPSSPLNPSSARQVAARGTSQLERALASHLRIASDRVTIQKTREFRGSVFVIFRVGAELGFAELRRDGSQWKAFEIHSDALSRVPKGSGEYGWFPIRFGHWNILGAYVDPDVTFVLSKTADGSTLDSDHPQDGASILVTRGFAPIDGYDARGLVFELLLPPRTFDVSAVTRDAIPAARSFLNFALQGKDANAATYLFGRVPPSILLPSIRRVLSRGGPISNPELASEGVAFFQTSPRGDTFRFTLLMARQTHTWKVWSYTYHRTTG